MFARVPSRSVQVLIGVATCAVIGALLFVVYSGRSQAAGNPHVATVAMYSTDFPQQNIQPDGVTAVTLESIPFQTASSGQVEVSADYEFLFLDPTNQIRTEIGVQATTLNCKLTLDGATLRSVANADQSFGVVGHENAMTATSPISPGSHSLALTCIAGLNLSDPNNSYPTLVAQMTSHGMSAVVAS